MRAFFACLSVGALFLATSAHADEVIGAPSTTAPSPSPSPSAAATAAAGSGAAAPSAVTPTSTEEAHAAVMGTPTTADQKTAVGPEPHRRWYGWQTLITDGAGMVVMIAGGSAQSGPVAGLGFATYGFGAPIVHWAHGNVGRGFASLGVRAAAPLTLGFASMAAFSRKNGGWDSLGYFALGFVTGMFAAIAVDAAILARDHVEPEEPPKSARPRIRLVPTLAPMPGGAMGGVHATF